jgi:hypothetical protein
VAAAIAAQRPMNSILNVATSVDAGGYGRQLPDMDLDKAVDLYALWNRAFESSRTDIDRNDGTNESDGSQLSSADRPHNTSGHADSAMKLADEPSGHALMSNSRPPDFDLVVPPAATIEDLSAVNSEPALVPSLTDGMTENSSAGPQPQGLTTSSAAGAISATANALNASAAAAPEKTTSSAQTARASGTGAYVDVERMGADSVNVFVRGSTVAIVVRDAGIEDAEALDCAFETAQKLTGQRAALQQLTLNGRVLYQQTGVATAVDRSRESSLVFTC